MKIQKTVCAAAALALTAGLAQAQSFTQNFDNVGAIAAAGWFMQNNSSPLGTTNWFQGNVNFFPAFGGSGYIGANFENTSGVGTISNWLITPQVTISNGNEVRFWTRSTGSNFADRLEVRMSTAGASTNVGATALEVGDFTTLLLAINPDLVAPPLSGHYPEVWTAFTIPISGLPAPTSGRFAFRYFVEESGPSGVNGDYIGIDEFQFSAGAVATGACIGPTGCQVLSAYECQVLGGAYQGNGSTCPASYEWSGSIAIPDGGPGACGTQAFAEILVAENQSINDISVEIFVAHGWQGDVKLSLHHVESNTTVPLVDRPGVSAINPFGFEAPDFGAATAPMHFIDSAASPYADPPVAPPGITAVSGEWKPLSPLSAFVGQNSAGSWRLVAQDCEEGVAGTLRFFRLHLDLGTGPMCYANCDGSTTPPILNVDDFTCFINAFAQAQALPHEQQVPHYANCDASTTAPVLNVDDFTCFINEFAQGCP